MVFIFYIYYSSIYYSLCKKGLFMLTHLEESLQRDIDRICDKVLHMSLLAEKMLKDCIKAYVDNDRKLAYAVILRDQYIDEKEKEIDRLCLEFIIRQQPIAKNLRFAYTTIKINLEIERVGDHAESIARHFLKMREAPIDSFKDRIVELANLSIDMFHDSIVAFIQQDISLAKKCIAIEDTVDALRTELTNQFIIEFNENKYPFMSLYPQLIIIRRLERIADLAQDICTEVLYMCTGEFAKHPGTEAFRILFVDDFNSCQSQIAEAIALSFRQPKFIFNSAGISPRPIDRSTIDFMKSKGFDLSRIAPKAIHQVPNLDHYQVIVILSKNCRQHFPEQSSKVIIIEWPVENLVDTEGSKDQLFKYYDETFGFLQSQIKDLVDAIIGTETI